jgi:dihydroorotase
MNLLIRQAIILGSDSKKAQDVLIKNGVIEKIADKIEQSATHTIEGEGLYISSGFVDLQGFSADPGFEEREDLHTFSKAAAKGGFSTCVVMPSTLPKVNNKAQVNYIVNKSKGLITNIIPSGSITAPDDENNLAELFDMYLAGAKVFTNDKKTIRETGLMSRALQYVKGFGGLVYSFPFDDSFLFDAYVNESANTMLLGLKGLAPHTETLILERDITLAAYHDVRLHVINLSCKESVDIIRKTKAKGLKITASVAAHQLFFNDESLKTFNSNQKVLPPYRGESDRLALIEGLKDGTIDSIISDHRPENIERKKLELDYAAFGIASLETTFSTAFTVLEKEMSIDKIVALFTSNPAQILGEKTTPIAEKELANITVFSTKEETFLEEKTFASRSKNNPFIGKTLKAKIKAVVNNGIVSIN